MVAVVLIAVGLMDHPLMVAIQYVADILGLLQLVEDLLLAIVESARRPGSFIATDAVSRWLMRTQPGRSPARCPLIAKRSGYSSTF